MDSVRVKSFTLGGLSLVSLVELFALAFLCGLVSGCTYAPVTIERAECGALMFSPQVRSAPTLEVHTLPPLEEDF